MKNISIFCFLLIGMLFLSGCYTTQGFVKLEEQQTQTVKQAKEGTLLMLKNWEFRSGLIHGALKSQMDTLPVEAIEAMDELDNLAKRSDELTDYDLGYALGLRIKMLGATVKAVVKQYAPHVLAYVPFK